jgi:hypothetical protein
MHSDFRCKYVQEIECPRTFTCVECFKQEDEWVKRWIRYLRLRKYTSYPTINRSIQEIKNKTE